MTQKALPTLMAPKELTEKPLQSSILSKKYPISARYVFRASFKSYLTTILLIVVWSLMGRYLVEHLPFETIRGEAAAFFILVVLPILWSLGNTIYHFLQRKFLEFGIDEGNFYLKRGIILSARGSFPLSKITEIYIDQNLVDAILDMRNVHLSTPSFDSHAFARIGGLRANHAKQLKQTLERLAHTQRVMEMRGVMFDSERDAIGDYQKKNLGKKVRSVDFRSAG